MKISTKGRYGLRIMLDLAMHADKFGLDVPKMLSDICRDQDFSRKYVGRLAVELRDAELILAVRGAHGGYMLDRPADEITLLEVLEAVEGPISIVDCVRCLPSEAGDEKGVRCISRNCEDAQKGASGCLAHEVWNAVNTEMRKALDRVTLRDILNHDIDMKPYYDDGNDYDEASEALEKKGD